MWVSIPSSGVSLHFQQDDNCISQLGKTFLTSELLYKETFPQDGQTRRVQLSSQPANLSCARHLIKPCGIIPHPTATR